MIYSSDEHVHFCCVLDVTLVELVPSRIMSGHCPDDSSVFLFLTSSSAYFCHSLQFILIVTITCSTDLDDSPDMQTTCLACCVCHLFLVIGSASLLEHGAHGKRSGRYHLLWKSFYKSGQNLSVNLSDYMNYFRSILFSTVQTELIENQPFVKIMKSVNTVSTTGMFPLMEGNDFNLITTVFPVTEGIISRRMFWKTDHEYPVFAHPALVLKRDFEKNKKLQDDRLCELTNREV